MACALALSAGAAQAQSDARPSVRSKRLEARGLIEIDGRVEEEVWQDCVVIDDFRQTNILPGEPSAVRTEVRICHDSKFLYVGIVCFDDPGEVRARQMDRDAFIRYDDRIEIWFDTFDTQRFGYWFQITPGGSIGDSLLSDGGGRFNKAWDGIWYGRSRVTDQGWEAEMAIPFQTLAFDATKDTWGMNVGRRRVANGERSRWASPDPAFRFFNLAEGGRLTGMVGMEQGYGVDVKPYARFDASRAAADGDVDRLGAAGLDLSWRPTPDANLRLTLNTDFAETEVDERQINLDRFPLFFPEKREFFLEDSGLFDFGAPSNRRRLLPFFSRTIGRDSDGQAVPILAGAKFTGRSGPWNVGFLDTYLDDSGDVGRVNAGVLRVTRNLGEQSAIGGIATAGDPSTGATTRTLGLDARFADNDFFGDSRAASVWVWGLTTDGSQPDTDGDAFGFEVNTRSADWQINAAWQRVDDGFDPGLGFVQRSGIDRAFWDTQRTWRLGDQGAVRQVEASLDLTRTLDRVGGEDGYEIELTPLELEFQSGDQLTYSVTRSQDRLDNGFEVSPGVDLLPGTFDLVRQRVELETNDRRRAKMRLSIDWGDFFSGELTRWTAEPILIPSKHFLFSVSYTDVEGDLPEGSFDTQLIGANFDWSVTPDVSWKNLAQYDTDSRDMSLQSRLRWILEPGQDLFLVGLFGWTREGRESFVVGDQELILKLTYTLRF